MTKTSLKQIVRITHKGSEGSFIYRAGERGVSCWRICNGLVRFDTPRAADGLTFAGIASAGDLLGSEVLLKGRYAHDARPLGTVTLTPCPEPSQELLLENLLAAQRRTEQMLALRIGDADGRIVRLLQILGKESHDSNREIFMPGLREMAEMTALNHETVCRVISRLRHLGQLQRVGRHNSVLKLDAPALASSHLFSSMSPSLMAALS